MTIEMTRKYTCDAVGCVNYSILPDEQPGRPEGWAEINFGYGDRVLCRTHVSAIVHIVLNTPS